MRVALSPSGNQGDPGPNPLPCPRSRPFGADGYLKNFLRGSPATLVCLNDDLVATGASDDEIVLKGTVGPDRNPLVIHGYHSVTIGRSIERNNAVERCNWLGHKQLLGGVFVFARVLMLNFAKSL